MSSSNSSSRTSRSSSFVGIRDWTCPFADTTASPTEDHPGTHTKSGFIATAADEASHVPAIRNGFHSYQTALDSHKPFSQDFLDHERVSTTKAIEQLHDLSDIFQDLTTKASNILNDQIPEDLRAELHLATVWVAKHRASLVSCHVFFKVNYSLARDKPNNGIVETNVKSADEIVEMCDYAVKEHRRQASSLVVVASNFSEG